MKIACAFDHAGAGLREVVLDSLRSACHEPIDLGTYVYSPDTARKAGAAIRDGAAERAVVVCGSGAGVSVAASKLAGIRAAVGHETYTANQCVEHDDCNVLCLGARVIGSAIAADVVLAFAQARFSGEERHIRRLQKIGRIEAEETQLP